MLAATASHAPPGRGAQVVFLSPSPGTQTGGFLIHDVCRRVRVDQPDIGCLSSTQGIEHEFFGGGYFERLSSIESDVLSQEAEQGAFSPPIDVVYTLSEVVGRQREDSARKESISEYGRFSRRFINFFFWGEAFLKRAICIYWVHKDEFILPVCPPHHLLLRLLRLLK